MPKMIFKSIRSSGTVTEVVHLDDSVFLRCARSYLRYEYWFECGILVDRTTTTEKIDFGDFVVWWKGKAYWTPLQNFFSAKEQQRLGIVSGVEADIKIPLKAVGVQLSDPTQCAVIS